ncbi:hypothetical protein ABW20_dc0105673 [Dactylellina cionopaga]|nr:hypothetical protein ABW20_dc0105673 [Dactylellina cionopaga]
MTTFNNLPVELHIKILSFLPAIEDQIRIFHTCRLWNSLTLHHPFLKPRYLRAAPIGVHIFVGSHWPRPPLGCTVLNGKVMSYSFSFRPEGGRWSGGCELVAEDISRCKFLDDPCFMDINVIDTDEWRFESPAAAVAAKSSKKFGAVPLQDPNIRIRTSLARASTDWLRGSLRIIDLEEIHILSVDGMKATVREIIEETVIKIQPKMEEIEFGTKEPVKILFSLDQMVDMDMEDDPMDFEFAALILEPHHWDKPGNSLYTPRVDKS